MNYTKTLFKNIFVHKQEALSATLFLNDNKFVSIENKIFVPLKYFTTDAIYHLNVCDRGSTTIFKIVLSYNDMAFYHDEHFSYSCNDKNATLQYYARKQEDPSQGFFLDISLKYLSNERKIMFEIIFN